MSNTVNEAFLAFNKDYVNLDPDRTDKARKSRDWLFAQLTKLSETNSDFSKLYDEKHINFGSFARNTKIRELDDIDLILTFSGLGSTYEMIVPGMEYNITPSANATLLLELCNDNGTLNSIKLVNKIVSALDGIDQYKSSEKHRKQEAATLSLTSYEWCFDIVPAFFTVDTQHYLIPDGSGGWKATDPRIDQERVNRINQQHSGRILQIIRTLKYWNRRGVMKNIPSYLFENIILNYFEAQATTSVYIDCNLRDFWNYLVQGIHFPVSDPKGFQGDLNSLTSDERTAISQKAKEAYSKAVEAINLEEVVKDQPAAIKKWAEIFGPQFA